MRVTYVHVSTSDMKTYLYGVHMHMQIILLSYEM